MILPLMLKTNKLIVQICEKCAKKQDKTPVALTSFWEDTCDICLQETLVTDISNFVIYLEDDF